MPLNETAAIESECRKDGLDIVTYPLYRIAQAFHIIPSLAAIPLLLHLQIKYIFGSTFHRNIKVILQMYYSSALLHAVAVSIAEIYEVISSLVNNACDFFPPTYVYALVGLSLAISYSELINSLLAMCCERIVATICSSKYESNGIALGLFLVLLTVAANLVTTWCTFGLDDFQVKMYTMAVVPPGAVKKFNKLAMVYIAISIVCMVAFYVSSRISRRQFSVGCATLTSRYQTRENVVTTQFAARIAFLQVIFYILSAASGIVIRVHGNQIFHGNKNLKISFRHLCYSLPIFVFVLPIYSVHQLKYYRLHRDKSIRSMMKMESRGVAGQRNYEQIIARSWQVDRKP